MLIVGIAGGTGSGKTTVVRKIIERLPEGEVAVIPQDAYYIDNSHMPLEVRQEINFDHPRSVEFKLLVDHLKKLKRGKSIKQPLYSYITCTRADENIVVVPKHVIIVEGILILTNPPLRKLLDIKVYVDADADDRLCRVINRDIIDRGRSIGKVLSRYEKSFCSHRLLQFPVLWECTDLIIPQGGNNKVGVNILVDTIQQVLYKHSEKR